MTNVPYFVILAGGSNSRFWPLRGKSLLRFCGRTLIEHQIDALRTAGCHDGLIVASPDTEAEIRAAVERYGSDLIVTVQEKPRGMGHAVLLAAEAAREPLGSRPLLIGQAHDVVHPEIYSRVLASGDGESGAVAGQRVSSYFPGGYLALSGDRILAVVEKPDPGNEPSDVVNIVIHRHPRADRLVELIRATYSDADARDDHYERALTLLCSEMPYRLVPYDGPWQPIKYPWHVLGAMQIFLDRIPTPAEPLPEGVRGNVVLGEGVRIFPGATVLGPAYIGAGSMVGTGALVRGAMLGDGCDVGFGCEVARSYLGDRCILHHNYVGDSVLEGEVAFGFGTVTGNWPFYPPPVRTGQNEFRLRTGLEKFGAIVGAGVRTGIGVLLNPGVKIGPRTYVGPGVMLDHDVQGGQLLLVKQELITRDNPFIRERRG